MASFNNSNNNNLNDSSFDNLLIQSLMSRLQLHPPHLHTNSYLSQSLDDLLLQHLPPKHQDDDEDDDDEDEELTSMYGQEEGQRRLLAKEEAKLEKEIIRIVHSGKSHETLKPNSGQSVSIGDHNICVGFHEEPDSDYRVWEWHGHIMLFDEENGFNTEYIYGNYFERLPEKKGGNAGEEESKEKRGGSSGLRDLIGDSKDSVAGAAGRVVHRNSMNTGSAAR